MKLFTTFALTLLLFASATSQTPFYKGSAQTKEALLTKIALPEVASEYKAYFKESAFELRSRFQQLTLRPMKSDARVNLILPRKVSHVFSVESTMLRRGTMVWVDKNDNITLVDNGGNPIKRENDLTISESEFATIGSIALAGYAYSVFNAKDQSHQPVPEPSPVLIVLFGAAALLVGRRLQ